MKTTLSWLKTHLDTEAGVTALAERLIMLGHDVESVADRAGGLDGFVVARVVSAEPHPNADRLRVCVVDNGTSQTQVVCEAPPTRAADEGRPRSGRRAHPENRRGARRKHDPRRCLEGHADVGGRARAGRGSFRHYRIGRGCAGRHKLCRAPGARRPGHRPQGHPKPGRLPRRPRYCPRPRRFGHGASETPRHDPGRGPLPLGHCHPYRRSHRLPVVSRPPYPRLAQRPEPALVARPPRSDRAAADLGLGRHHQFRDLRPQSAAPCVRRQEAQGRPDRAVRPAPRKAARAQRPRLRARPGGDRDRRPARG